MKINNVEISAESFPIRAFYGPKDLTDFDWHINRIQTTQGVWDEIVLCRFAAIALLAAVNYSGDKTAAAEALETTKRNAFSLLHCAAGAEHDRAVIMLADCYAKGTGTPQDLRLAAATLEVAKKICNDGRYSKWIEAVETGIKETIAAVTTKALQRPTLQ